jgi:LacI family transcriptional regulator
MRRSEPPRVAILVDTSSGWGRRLIRGIAGYSQSHGPWHLWVEGRGRDERLRLPPGWIGEGIIARVSDHFLARHVAASGVPVVNISSIELSGERFPSVATDLDVAGTLAARYLLDRGLRNFGYCGLPRLSYVRRHYESFRRTVSREGCACPAYMHGSSTSRSQNKWLDQQRELMLWLQGLPKPVGILAWGTWRGQEVLDACRWGSLLVPEQVAVLAGDDDELLCQTCSPSLSGIAVASEQIGHAAAALLDRLMQGRRPPRKPILLAPTGVTTRQSTETLAIDNSELAQAVRFIREHAAEPITVDSVLQVVAISRRQLEIDFRKTLGRTPGAEIRRVRMERAKDLLNRTSMSVPEVAAASGFGSPEYLATAFKHEMGVTPLKYRNQARVR